MEYKVVVVGAFGVNCAVLWDRQRAATVVDPGEDAERILGVLRSSGLTLRQIVLTHGHIDHISALDVLLAVQPVPVKMHAADAAWAFTDVNVFPPYNNVPARPAALEEIDEGSLLAAGDTSFRVLHTPGHSPGSICLYCESEALLISGDTLFAGTVGRTDLPGGNGSKLARSLKRLAVLPDAVTILPGHGPATTIGDEIVANPFLRGARRT
ncbi:MAG: MBL fold metallo-hydrolase [Kiritimatiellae bacterium]|nr:MBL fold metallo-hydrolase [Kiritimatiellia bacterium]